MKMTKKDYQVLWVFAALERLQGFGFIHGADYNLSPSGIDVFLEVDDHRHVLFDNEEVFEQIITFVCKDKEVVQSEQEINDMIQIVRRFRDDRDSLVKFALAHIVKK